MLINKAPKSINNHHHYDNHEIYIPLAKNQSIILILYNNNNIEFSDFAYIYLLLNDRHCCYLFDTPFLNSCATTLFICNLFINTILLICLKVKVFLKFFVVAIILYYATFLFKVNCKALIYNLFQSHKVLLKQEFN